MRLPEHFDHEASFSADHAEDRSMLDQKSPFVENNMYCGMYKVQDKPTSK